MKIEAQLHHLTFYDCESEVKLQVVAGQQSRPDGVGIPGVTQDL